MQRLHEEYDSDLTQKQAPTDYQTGENHFASSCGVCGKRLYVDEDTIEQIDRALSNDFESPLVCEDCESDLDSRRVGE